MICDVCDSGVDTESPTSPTNPPGGVWIFCGRCFATVIVSGDGSESRPPYRSIDDRWCAVVDENNGPSEVEHATLTQTSTLCGLDIGDAGLTATAIRGLPIAPAPVPHACRLLLRPMPCGRWAGEDARVSESSGRGRAVHWFGC